MREIWHAPKRLNSRETDLVYLFSNKWPKMKRNKMLKSATNERKVEEGIFVRKYLVTLFGA